MSSEAQRPFHRFRSAAVITALVTVVGSAVLLLLAYKYQPNPIPAVHAKESGKLSPEIFNVSQTLLTTLLGIGLLSLAFEVLLRESYGRDLLHFLNLRTAIVRSGLQHVEPEDGFDWSTVLRSSTVTVLMRDPSLWLNRHLPALLDECVKRVTTIKVMVPQAGGSSFAAVAKTIGLSETDLDRNIDLARRSAETMWKQRKTTFKAGSTLTILPYQGIPLYEIVLADDNAILLLTRAMGHDVGDLGLVVAIEQSDQEYPSNWLRDTVSNVNVANSIFAGATP